MSDDEKVTVVVVNFASSAHLERLLDSLAPEPVERVIVWDNYSSDAERDRLMEVAATYPRVQFHLGATNLGFAGGVNAAVATIPHKERTGLLWVLNPDTIVAPHATRTLTRSIAMHRAAIVSPLILFADSEIVWYSGGHVHRKAGRSEHLRIGERRGPKDVGYDDVSFISGAAPMFTWEAWQTLRGFDERFFLYCEDADLSIRAVDAGLRLGIERAAVVYHAEGGSSTNGHGPGPAFYFYVQRNRLVLYRTFTNQLNLLLGRGAIETARLVLLPLRVLSDSPVRKFKASISGMVAGLRGQTGAR